MGPPFLVLVYDPGRQLRPLSLQKQSCLKTSNSRTVNEQEYKNLGLQDMVVH